MKNRIIAAALCVTGSIFSPALSQNTTTCGYVLGASMYSQTYSFNGISIGSSPGSRDAFLAGGVAEFNVAPSLALRPGLIFVMRGGSGAASGSDSNLVGPGGTWELNYLTIPIDLKLKFPTANAGISPYVCSV